MQWMNRDIDVPRGTPLLALGPASTDDLQGALRRLGLQQVAKNLRRTADGLLEMGPGHGEIAGLLRVAARKLDEKGGGK